MPTKRQLSQLRESEMEFGKFNTDDGYNVRGSHMAGTGKCFTGEYTGAKIGTIKIDPVTKDFKIEVDTTEENDSHKDLP